MSQAAPPQTPPAPPPPLERFFEHVRYANPFDVNRVGQGGVADTDAEPVHHAAFTRLLELVDQARRQQVGVGTLLWGEAGIGKSHLLARLGAWAGPDSKHAVFVYLSNLQAAPSQLPRSLLRCTLSILTRGRTSGFHDTLLYRIIRAAVRQALDYDGSRQYTFDEAETAFQQLVDELCDQGPGQPGFVDRAVFAALFRFFCSAYAARSGPDDGRSALAVRWLSGDPLDRDEAHALGLPAPREETTALEDDMQVRSVLVALAQVAKYREQPLLLCCDQVDSLDAEQCGALTRFLHGLLDCAPNLLVITCGVRETLQRWLNDGDIQQATWDRLTQYELMLQRVSPHEARQIVQVRLHPFQEPFLALEPVRGLVQQDILFPLGEAWAREFLADKVEVRPRDVINWAREGWRREQELLRQQGGAEWLARWPERKPGKPDGVVLTDEELRQRIDEKVSLKVQELKRQRQLEPQTLPPDGDNLAGLIEALLQRCLNAPSRDGLLAVERVPARRYGPQPPYHLRLRHRGPVGAESGTGLRCVVVSNRTSMSARLRRLADDTQPPDRLVLVTDERRPLEPGPVGKEYLDCLQSRHGRCFHVMQLSFDQYAELEALQAVVGLARAGDLEIELPGGQARRVHEEEVIASHHRCRRYQAHPLLALLLQAGPPAEPPSPPPEEPVTVKPLDNGSPSDKDLREFIMGRLAITMGASSQELAVQYQDYLSRKQIAWELPACKARLEAAAQQLHADGLVHATPFDDNLWLMKK
jgi:hypothetical protein